MNIKMFSLAWGLLYLCSVNVFAEHYVQLFYGNSSGNHLQTNAKATSYHSDGCGWFGCYSAGRGSYFGGGARQVNHNFDDNDILGVRYGFWFEQRSWHGFSIDVRQLQFKSSWDGELDQSNGYSSEPLVLNSEIDVIPVTLMYNLRFGLQKSADYPHGKVQLYAGLKLIGYNYYDGTVNANFNGAEKFKFSNNSTSNIGEQDYRIGALWFFTPNFATTLEYRKTELPISLNRSDKGSVEQELTGFNFDSELDQIYLGILYQF